MKKNLVEETPTIKETFNEFVALEKKEEAPRHKSPKAQDNGEMSRFNIYIPTSQLEKIKILAIKEHKKIKEVIEEAISLYLENK